MSWNPTHVQVTVQRAKGLLFKGKNETNDAFVVIALGKEKFQTSIKERSSDPVEWHEECDLEIPRQGNTASVQLTVYHRNGLGMDEFLGQMALPLNEFDVYERPKTRSYKLHGKPDKSKKKAEKERGELEVKLAFIVKSGEFLDVAKKDKHKTSLSSIKNIGGSLLSLGSKEKRGIKALTKSVSSRMDKIVAKKKQSNSRGQTDNCIPSELMESRQWEHADPGVISDDDDDLAFEDMKVSGTVNSSPYSGSSRASSIKHPAPHHTVPEDERSLSGVGSEHHGSSHLQVAPSRHQQHGEAPAVPSRASPASSHNSLGFTSTNSSPSPSHSSPTVRQPASSGVFVSVVDDVQASVNVELDPFAPQVISETDDLPFLSQENNEIEDSPPSPDHFSLNLNFANMTPVELPPPKPRPRRDFVANYDKASSSDEPPSPALDTSNKSVSRGFNEDITISSLNASNLQVGKTGLTNQEDTLNAQFSGGIVSVDDSGLSMSESVSVGRTYANDYAVTSGGTFSSIAEESSISPVHSVSDNSLTDELCGISIVSPLAKTPDKRSVSNTMSYSDRSAASSDSCSAVARRPGHQMRRRSSVPSYVTDTGIRRGVHDVMDSEGYDISRSASQGKMGEEVGGSSVGEGEGRTGAEEMGSRGWWSAAGVRVGSVQEKRSSDTVGDEWERKLRGKRSTLGSLERLSNSGGMVGGGSSRSSLNNSCASSTHDLQHEYLFSGGARLPEVKALTLERGSKPFSEESPDSAKKAKRGLKSRLFSKGSKNANSRVEEEGRVVEGGNDRVPNPALGNHHSKVSQDVHNKFAGKSREDLLEHIMTLESLLARQVHHTRDLEDYIDNLLLRVMDASPHLLQNPLTKQHPHSFTGKFRFK